MRPGLLPTLGVVGVTTCGPGDPQATTGVTGDDAGTDTGNDPATSSEPPTSSEPTMPMRACDHIVDCSYLYCGYCDINGFCRDAPHCCGVDDFCPDDYCRDDDDCAYDERCESDKCVPKCLGDEYCPPGEVCEGGICIPAGPQLRPCADPGGVFGQWALSVTPTAFVLADLDADGDLDLAAAQPSVAQIEIALNDGAGEFTLAGAFGVGDPAPGLGLAVGDLDDDGDNDFAVVRGDPNGGLILLFGQDAVFTPQPPLATGPNPVGVRVREISDDVLDDIVVLGAEDVTTRLGDAQASFVDEVTALSDPVDSAAVLFDFSKDGRLDLVAKLPGGNAVGVWAGDGDGRFTPDFSIDPNVASDAVQVADLNLLPLPPEDDLPHLVFAHAVDGTGQIDVWPVINSPQMFDVPVTYLTSVPITGGVLADFDAAASLDLVSATGQDNVVIAQGDGEGGFACERIIPAMAPTTQPLLVVGDLNGDGRGDIVTGDASSPTVTMHISL